MKGMERGSLEQKRQRVDEEDKLKREDIQGAEKGEREGEKMKDTG